MAKSSKRKPTKKELLSRRKIISCLRASMNQDQIILEDIDFFEPLNLQLLLELRISKRKGKTNTGIDLLDAFEVKDHNVKAQTDHESAQYKTFWATNILYKKKIHITNCRIHSAINFSGSVFSDWIIVDKTIIKEALTVRKCDFQSELSIQACTIGGIIDFASSRLRDKFYLTTTKCQSLLIKNAYFQGVCLFRGLEVYDIVHVAKSVFEKTADFSYLTLTNSDNEAGYKSAIASNAIRFDNTEFKGNVDFGGVVFNSDTYFKGCKFSGETYFGPAKTNTDAQGGEAKGTTFNENAFFNDAIFMGRSYLMVKFKKHADFSDIVVTGQLYLYVREINSLNFKNATVGDNFSFSPHINEQILLDRETARKFKHVSIVHSNTISAMLYKAREMSLYRKELSYEICNYFSDIILCRKHIVVNNDSGTTTKGSKIFIKINEWVLLSLNKISNNYGLSWIRGVLFTIICWIFFFTLTIIAQQGITDDSLLWLLDSVKLKQFFEYFWLFSFTGGLIGEKITILVLVLFLLGKIFIGYGIYQTISAFRKHGKL